MRYYFQEGDRPNTKKDSLSFGFITPLENAVLLRIDSKSSNDYIEFEIVSLPLLPLSFFLLFFALNIFKVGGCLFVAYNLGMRDITVGDKNVRINDGSYHVVRFERIGANSTLQIDDYQIQSTYRVGRQMLVFNTQNLLQIGGKWNQDLQKIDRPFIGVMAGMVFNGLRPLDFAKNHHPLTKIQGNFHTAQLFLDFSRNLSHFKYKVTSNCWTQFPLIIENAILVYST